MPELVELTNLNAERKAAFDGIVISAGPNYNLVGLGDSFIAYELYPGAGDTPLAGKDYFSSKGAIVWANAILGGRMNIRKEWMLGVIGNKTDQILARVPQAIALRPGFVFLDGAINDLNDSYALTDTIANKKATIDALLAAGITVIAEPVLPRTTWSIITGQQIVQARRKIDAINRWLREYARQTPGLYVTNADFYVTDRSTTQDNPYTSPVFYAGDGVHYFTLGSYWRGRALAEVLNYLIPPMVSTTFRQNGIYDPVDNPFGNLVVNGQMTGSYTQAAQAGVTGSLPTTYTMSRASGSTITAVSSKVALTDGGEGWQVAISTPGTGAVNEQMRLRGADINAGASTFVPGDKLKGYARIRVKDLVNIQGIHFAVAQNNGTTQVNDHGGLYSSELASDRWPANHEGDLLIETPEFTVAPYSGSGTQRITPSIYVWADGTKVASGTVTALSFEIKKVGAA